MSPMEKLKRALRAEIDEAACRPFTAPLARRLPPPLQLATR